ncbi:MAG: RNA polymerase sigma-70 factor (ECF subfamily), partial [Verrucomicrobiales bacterium]
MPDKTDTIPASTTNRASSDAQCGMQVGNSYTGSPGNREVQLFERMGMGDSGALEELYQIYSNPLYSYAFKMLTNQEEAEEVLQDTFVRLWKKATKFRPEVSKPFTWSTMILRGLCLDRLRKRNVRSRIVVVELSIVENLACSSPKGIERLYFSELTSRVRKALQGVNAEERQCLELAIFGDATHPEIAEKLGQPLGTVKSRIRRGLIKLRELLKGIH